MTQSVSQVRSSNYAKQLRGSIVFKELGVVASFLVIPLMIRYLGQECFGVWSTLLSVMSWVMFFDLGIGNGMRNKLAEALARNELYEACGYVSSGYSLIGIISLSLFVAVAGAACLIPWQAIFNTRAVDEETLRHTVQITLFFIVLNFWIGLINQVLNALQKTSAVVFGQFLSNAFALTLVFVLGRTTVASLIYMAFAYGLSLVSANIVLSFWFYRQRRDLIPRATLDRQHIAPILSLGIQFFILQLSVLVILTTDKILIAQIFGPQYVTQYDVVFKLFSIVSVAHLLICIPLWSAYTEAYHKADFAWIRRTLQRQLWIFGVIVLAVVIMISVAKPVLALWIGNDLEVSMPLVIAMGVFVVISTWNNIYAHCVNGIGAITPQFYTSLVGMLINIPLALLLTKVLGFGLEGIVMATSASLLLFSVIGPIQIYNLIFRKAVAA